MLQSASSGRTMSTYLANYAPPRADPLTSQFEGEGDQHTVNDYKSPASNNNC